MCVCVPFHRPSCSKPIFNKKYLKKATVLQALELNSLGEDHAVHELDLTNNALLTDKTLDLTVLLVLVKGCWL